LSPASPGATLAAVRARRPLVHCLTNPVAANLTANALICLGASPLMAEAVDEVGAVAAAADALLVNLGMQVAPRMTAARLAIGAARGAGTPWVLDPVAAGAIPARTALARAMASDGPGIIKGNASEIWAVAGSSAAGRGTDALHDPADVLQPARQLACDTGAVVAITGAVDWVTDGRTTMAVRRGHPAMARVSALGCVAGAMAAACLAVEPDAMRATCHALTLFGLAGERAGERAAGPGSFVAALLDALAALDPADPALLGDDG
jgi:hydroxyethylthiazole kinase